MQKQFYLLNLMLFWAVQISLACVPHSGTYYWVGGAGNWDDLSHWDTLSGGPGNAVCQVPQSFNNVVFDANAGLLTNDVVAIVSSSVCNNVVWTTGVSGVGFSGNARLDVYASMHTEPNQSFSSWIGEVHFLSSGTDSVLFNGNRFYNNKIVFEPLNGHFTVLDLWHHYNSSTTLQLNQGPTGIIDFKNSFKGGRLVQSLSGVSNFDCSIEGGWAGNELYTFTLNGSNATVNLFSNSSIYIFNHLSGSFNTATASVHNWKNFSTKVGAATASMDIRHATVTIKGSWFARNPTFNLMASGSEINLVGSSKVFHPGNLSYGTVKLHEFYIFYTYNINQPVFDSLVVKKGFYNAQTANYQINTLLQLENKGSYNSDYNLSNNGADLTFDIQPSAATILLGNCQQALILKNLQFNFAAGAAAQINANFVRLENVQSSGPDAPYDIGVASYQVPGSNNTAWVAGGQALTIPTPRYLRWVGSVPNSSLNTSDYGLWDDPNNWADGNIYPTAMPGDTSLPNSCPPNLADSVLFPNGSYVHIKNAHAECKSMVWLQDGCIFDDILNKSNNLRRLSIFGSLIFSASMDNQFKGIIAFRTWQPYAIIQSSGKPFNFKTIFEASNDQGTWYMTDTFSVPTFQTRNYVLQFKRGILHTQGHPIIAASLESKTGLFRQLHLYNSPIYITGKYMGSATGRYPFDINSSNNNLTIFAGSSHIHMTDMTNNQYTRFIIGGGHRLHKLSFYGPQPWLQRISSSLPNQYHQITFHQRGRFYTHVNTVDSIHHFISHASNSNAAPFLFSEVNTSSTIVIDTAEFKGSVQFNIDIKYNNLMKLYPGKEYIIAHPSNHTQTLRAPNAVLSAEGSCTNSISISGGNFFSSIPQSVRYVNLTDNHAAGAMFSFTNSILNANVSGWTGVSDVPRKLHWLDISPGNSLGYWNSPSNWSLADGYMLDAAGGNDILVGNCPPTQSDTVVFSNGSFSGVADTVGVETPSQKAKCASMLWLHDTSIHPVLKGSNPTRLDIYQSLLFSESMQQHFDGEVQFKGTSVGCSITSSGQAFNHKVHFNGTGEWILQDSFTAPNLLSPFSYTTQLTEGTLNTNNQTLSTYNLGAEGAATTKLILANSAIIITGVYIGATGKFPFQTTGSGYSVDAGTSTIHFNGPQNSYYNGMRGGAQQRYYNVRFNYLASLYAMQDTFNNVHFENGGYLRGNGDIQTKFDRIESYGSYALNLQNGSLEIDTLRFGGDGIINGNNLYHHELSFNPSKSYTFRSGDIQQLDNAAEFNAIGTGGGGEITFNSSVAGQNAYIRKDSGRLCVDYIYVRDNWAIGNGLSAENPLCISNPLCDTLLNSSLIPSFVNAGRARFQAGANANNQGNNAGWDFTPYPPPPALRLTTPNQTLCPGDSILLEFEIEGQLPASVRFFMDDGNGLIAVDSIDILPSSGSGTNIDPFLWQFYVPATSNTTFSTDNISILRCFNDNALGSGLATINFDCFLPLELHTFTARPLKESVQLDWTTELEKNCSHFWVQRSTDLQKFEDIGFVLAQGTSLDKQHYRLEDENPLIGMAYYRLKIVDTDGSIAYSDLEAVHLGLSESYFKVYPNPVPSQETFQVVVGVTSNTTAKLQVFDSRGQFVHQEDIISKEGTRIEVLNLPSNFPAGIYWLRLLMGDQNLTQKLLIR